MPRRRRPNQPVELEAAATFEAWDEMDEASKRKIRNRLAQRHFRERKSLYIKSLEIASQATSQSESARNKELVREIADLRATIMKMRAQILKLVCSLHSVGAEAGKVLHSSDISKDSSQFVDSEHVQCQSPLRDLGDDNGGPSPGDFDFGDDPDEPVECADLQHVPVHETSSSDQLGTGHLGATVPIPPTATIEGPSSQPHFDPSAAAVPDQGGHVLAPSGDGQSGTAFCLEPVGFQVLNNTAFSSARVEPESNYAPFADQTWHPHPFNQQQQQQQEQQPQEPQYQTSHSFLPSAPPQTNMSMPTGHYSAFVGTTPVPNHSSSTFTRHMETLELQVRSRLDGSPGKSSRDRLIRSCSAIMSLFVQNAWPSSYSVWFKSQVPQIIGPILLWRLSPSYDTYNLLGAHYKPTELQLSVPHSAVIDWIPYAELRDRVIMYYNYSVVLDRLLCDMMNSYVIEVPDLAQVIPHAPRGRAYFGIWNMFRAIDLAFGKQDPTQTLTQPQTYAHPAYSPPSSADFSVYSDEEASTDVEDPFGIYHEFVLCDRLGSPLGGRVFGAGEGGNHQEAQHGSSTIPQGWAAPQRSGGGKHFNLIEIFNTPASVLKLSHDIRLYATRSWRLDRALFDKYPELKFPGYENCVAKGRSCRIPTAPPDGPHEMTKIALQRYEEALAALA